MEAFILLKKPGRGASSVSSSSANLSGSEKASVGVASARFQGHFRFTGSVDASSAGGVMGNGCLRSGDLRMSRTLPTSGTGGRE
jgi:hypothetical protein